jgi:microcystin-dependent protein
MPSSADTPYVGQLALFGFNFAPAGWYLCDGSLVPIAENETLFNLIGTTYGGDGQETFALPDLRGRAPVHAGGAHVPGELGGVETVTLTSTQIPAHTHTLAGGGAQTTNQPTNAYPADDGQFGAASGSYLLPASSAGGSQPHENMQPYLVMTWCISAFGVFPSPA